MAAHAERIAHGGSDFSRSSFGRRLGPDPGVSRHAGFAAGSHVRSPSVAGHAGARHEDAAGTISESRVPILFERNDDEGDWRSARSQRKPDFSDSQNGSAKNGDRATIRGDQLGGGLLSDPKGRAGRRPAAALIQGARRDTSSGFPDPGWR